MVLKWIVVFVKVICYFFSAMLSSLFGLFCKKKRPDFSCNIVLIVGAAQGLGKELALKFSEYGATLVLWDINEAKLRQTCSEITAQGHEVFPYVVDCTDKDAVYHTADQVREDVGNVSVLVNNAGVLHGKSILELKDEQIHRTVDVNFKSHFWTIRAFLPWMLKNDYGYICEICSIGAFTGGPYATDYNATKAAVLNFSEGLRAELLFAHKPGVSVTCVCPWLMNTTLVPAHVIKTFNFDRKVMLSPEYVADRTIEAICNQDFIVTIPSRYFWVRAINLFLPRKLQEIILISHLDIDLKAKDD